MPHDDDESLYTPGELRWIADQRQRVAVYLTAEGVAAGGLAAEPELVMAPLLSLWAVSGPEHGGEHEAGWWVIAGDVPTDHVSRQRAVVARAALRTFSKKWRTAASVMTQRASGENADGVSAEQRTAAAEHLFERARILWEIQEDEALWA